MIIYRGNPVFEKSFSNCSVYRFEKFDQFFCTIRLKSFRKTFFESERSVNKFNREIGAHNLTSGLGFPLT